MKLKLLTLACLAVLPALGLSPARAADASDLSAGDKTFIVKATGGNLFEVETGKVAQDQGTSQDVKDFGSKMVEDHGKALDEIKGIAATKGVDVPSDLDAKHQKMLDDLKAKSGTDFDTAYLHMMWKAHMMDNKAFMNEANAGSDPDVKAYAQKTDEVIRMHIQMLKDIKAKMK